MEDYVNSKKIVLEELRKVFDKVYEAGDLLDSKLQNILNYSSIVVSVPIAIIASTFVDKLGIIFWALMVVVILIYIADFIVIEIGLKPKEYFAPVSQNIDIIKKNYYSVTEEWAVEQAIIDNLHCSKEIKKSNELKSNMLTAATILMGIIVFIIFISIPIGLRFSTPTLIDVFSKIKP